MKKTALNIFAFVLAVILATVNAGAVVAAPRLTLTPISGNYTNGSTFTVSIGVNSETEKSSAVDVWSTFDESRLEVVSIAKSANPPFPFEMTPVYDNAAGTFQFSCVMTNMNPFSDVAINGELAVVTFRAKAVGTAALNFTCVSGSTVDSNIFNSTINDVINCSDNSVGSYVINAGSNPIIPTPTTAESSTTTRPTSTPATASTTTTLPQAGSVGATIGLIIFGVVGLASALFLGVL